MLLDELLDVLLSRGIQFAEQEYHVKLSFDDTQTIVLAVQFLICGIDT